MKFGILFNWAYFDGYENTNSGKFGFGFTLILLSKFGHQKERDSFYAKKYFKAFPFLIDEFKKPTYGTVEQYAANCYSIRTFERFLDYFGLIEIEKLTSIFDSESYISKTDLFDKLIKRDPPNARYS